MWTDEEKWVLGGLAAVGLALWGRRMATAVADTVVDFVGRGPRLTFTSLDSAGDIPNSPDELVASASAVLGRQIAPPAYALGRMARSEGIAQGALRIHVALNDMEDLNARRGFGWDPVDLITYSTDSNSRGYYGQQLGRRYASTDDPYAGDIILAENTLAEHGRGIDPTGGGIKFVDIKSFGVQKGTGSYADTVAKWATEGLAPFGVPGESSDFVVFRRV